MVKESNAQECIEINPRPSVVPRNDQNQSNKHFNPNPKLCAPKGSKAQNAVYLISRTKKKISPKNRHERDQEITVAETEKAIKSFENNKSPGNDGLSAEFYKTFNELLKKNLHKLYIENSQLWQVPRSMRQTVISCLYKKETERT